MAPLAHPSVIPHRSKVTLRDIKNILLPVIFVIVGFLIAVGVR